MHKKRLKKELRLFDVFAISTGAMFSSGFFLLPGIAAAQTGASVYLAYLASGLLIIPAMLSVAELSTAMPRAGGAYYFLDRSLGPMIGTVGGLGSWFALIFKSAFALIGMGAYLSLYIDVSFTVLAIVLTLVFGLLNIVGAKETTLLQRVLVTTLIVIMGVFVIQGIAAVAGTGLSVAPEPYAAFFKGDLHGFIATIGLVFVSYAGLTKVASVAEEVENPDRNIPLGMFLSLLTAIVIYVVGVYIMLKVLPPAELYASLTPVADAGAVFLDWLPGSTGIVAVVVAAVAAFASTGNAGIMSASRYPFAMARDRLVSPRFGRVGKTGTPVFAITTTVGLMIGVLTVFDVEAVAKLASAFQLLLFGLLCFAVVVMRESKIDAYAPGFRSPLYPWVQVAGMLISVWLIAEMGILAVALTGAIAVFCVVWYFYYAGGKLRRQGAIFHVHERLGRRRYDGLEHELLTILNEKNSDKRLRYEEIVARSVIVNYPGRAPSVPALLDEAAGIFAGRLKITKKAIRDALQESYRHRLTNLSNDFIIIYLRKQDIAGAEMIVLRLAEEIELGVANLDSTCRTLVFLITPDEAPGLDMRIVGHLAEIVDSAHFGERWDRANTDRELREILIRDEHFTHQTVRRGAYFGQYIGQTIQDVCLPGDCLIAIVYRYGDLIIPHGQTVLEPGDELSIIGSPEHIQAINASGQPAQP